MKLNFTTKLDVVREAHYNLEMFVFSKERERNALRCCATIENDEHVILTLMTLLVKI